MARRKAFTKKRRSLFLECLRDEGNVAMAAREIGMNRQYMYDLREQHADFAEEWDGAISEWLDECEKEAVRRAVTGIKRQKIRQKVIPGEGENGQEKIIEIVREGTTHHSDRLLEFILSHRHPDYQKPIKHEHSGPGGKPLQIEDKSGWDLSALSYDELKQLRALQQKAKPTPDASAE